MSTAIMWQHELCLGLLEDIPPGEGRAYHIDGEAIAVFRRRDGQVFALPKVN